MYLASVADSSVSGVVFVCNNCFGFLLYYSVSVSWVFVCVFPTMTVISFPMSSVLMYPRFCSVSYEIKLCCVFSDKYTSSR